MATQALGSLANQRYEINKFIQRHLEVVNHTPASHETTRWKEGNPAKPVGNPFVKSSLVVKQLNRRNEALSNRLYTIMHEEREARSYEYAPGWRAGLDGAVIDCYPSAEHTAVKNRFLQNSEEMRHLHYRRLDEQNQKIAKYIDEQKTCYPRERFSKDYAETRRLFRIFQNRTAPSEMHLNLISKAKKDMERKNRRYAELVAQGKVLGSPSRSRNSSPSAARPFSSPQLRRAATSPSAGGLDRLAENGSSTADLQPPQPSPLRPSSSKTAQRLHAAVDSIHNTEQFVDAQAASAAVAVAVALEVRTSSEGGWNTSTNDNVDNSAYNNKGRAERPHSAYSQRREPSQAFKKVLDQTAKEKQRELGRTRPQSAGGVLPSPGSTFRALNKYVEVSAPEGKKKDFTIYDAKERVTVSASYPAGSFRSSGTGGDLIDFQALAVEQATKQGHSAKWQSTSLSPKRPKEVFPGIENGPDWVHFPHDEELGRTYSEKNSLRSPTKGGPGFNSRQVQPSLMGMKGAPFDLSDAAAGGPRNVSFQRGMSAAELTGGFQGVGAVPRQGQGQHSGGVKLGKVTPELARQGSTAAKRTGGRGISAAQPRPASGVAPLRRAATGLAAPCRSSLRSQRFGVNSKTNGTSKASDSEDLHQKKAHFKTHTPKEGRSREVSRSATPADSLDDSNGNGNGRGWDAMDSTKAVALTEDEIRAMENLEDVEDGLSDKSMVLHRMRSESFSDESVQQLPEDHHELIGLRLLSHSGLETRSSSIFHNLEMNPRLAGYALDEADGSELHVPEVYEVSVFDVGYVLPCTNAAIEFSTEKSKQNSEPILQSSRALMKQVSSRRLSTADSFAQLLAEQDPEEVGLFFRAVRDQPKEPSGSSKKVPKPYGLLSSKSQKPGDKLSIAQQHDGEDRLAALSTTYGILVEAVAQVAQPRQAADDGTPRRTTFAATSGDDGGDGLPVLARGASAALQPGSDKQQRSPATCAYRLISLSELYELSVKTGNDEMVSLVGEMLSFAYQFGEATNPRAASPTQRSRRQLHFQDDRDSLTFPDEKETFIYPCLQNMLDRHTKRALTHLIKNHVEVVFNTDEECVTIATK